MDRPITLKDATRFFLPLIFMTELNMISKSVIHAFLARMVAPKVALAAFSVSFGFYYTLTSPTEISMLLSISYLKSRRAIGHLLGFFCVVLAGPMVVVQLVAWSSLGDWLYGGVFGASPEAIAQARLATFLLSFSAPILMLRALAFAMLMLNRRTVWITYSTLLRLLSLAISLVVLPRFLAGAPVGAAALVTCMAVETAFAWAAAWRGFAALPATEGGPPPPYRELWRFSWPLMMNQASEMGVFALINIFMGRLANPDLALAAFGVVHGLASVLLSPVRNLVVTAQTMARWWGDVWVLFRFTHRITFVFAAAVAATFLSPLRSLILTDVMGLTPELAGYAEPAVKLVWIVAVFWGYAALGRGLLAAARRTRTVAASGLARLALVVAMGSVGSLLGGLNGALLGVVIWAAAFAAEATILCARLFWRRPGAEPLFADTPPGGAGAVAGG